MLRVILCSGLKRSASTWSYNVCRHFGALYANAVKAELIAQYSNDIDQSLRTLEKEVSHRKESEQNPNIIAVLKAHEQGPYAQHLIQQNLIHNIYTIRDPRDCMASMEKFWPRAKNESFDHRIREYQRWLIDGEMIMQDDRSLIIRFEDCQDSTKEQISRIAQFLKMRITPDMIEKIDQATNTDAAQKYIDQLVENKQGDQRAFCSTSQLHENHLDGGKTGRWLEDFSHDEQIKLETAFYPWITSFGYDLQHLRS